jgi:hypothetical protein
MTPLRRRMIEDMHIRNLELPRFRGELRAWDQGIGLGMILISYLYHFVLVLANEKCSYFVRLADAAHKRAEPRGG